MKLADVIDNLTKLLASVDKKSFVYDFLAAFGTPKATLARLKSGNLNVAKKAGCILLKGKVYFEPVMKELIKTPSPREIVESATVNPQIERNKPRFLFSTNFKEFVAYDTKRKEWLEVAFKELGEHYTFFLPLAGMEKTSFQEETDADVRAAEQMAKLYDLIIADNPPSSKAERHQLNVFLTRLLFCLFAEDTGIFPNQLFTNAVKSFTQSDGSDVGQLIQDIFLVLNTEVISRKKIKPHLAEFPYVNGGLFNDTAGKRFVVPQFTNKSRLKLIDLGGKSWREINPDIFGSMFQGVVDAEVRADLGMHYTSVPNIMKVIKPLFLDDLYEELEKAKGSEGKLSILLERIYRLQIFDPACGSGNFLIIAYKELRRLEMIIFKELQSLTTQLPLSGIHVSQFYGIEIDDFAHEVAILAMWLAEHQMNVEFKMEFGRAPASLPLREGARITCKNATILKWEDVCPCTNHSETFVMGNPPYLGSTFQEESHKADMKHVFSGKDDYKNLDYIACWFYKAAQYIKGRRIQCAFVTTNSICQGEQVAMLWRHILELGVEIRFAHLSFTWKNNAKSKAGVTCVIIGLQESPIPKKTIYSEGIARSVQNINPYLINARNSYVEKRREPLSKVPTMNYGNKPVDGGNLILDEQEYRRLIEIHPEAQTFVRRFFGSTEFINSKNRYCLWIDENNLKQAVSIPAIKERVERVKKMRLESIDPQARKMAEKPYQFREHIAASDLSMIIPRVSSERREYLPFGFFKKGEVIIDSAFGIYNAETWIFSVLSSKLHIAWVRAVAGRLREDIRYSNTICYNNFPFPEIKPLQKNALSKTAESILVARERYPSKKISDLYDPDKMPAELIKAHKENDLSVERCYRAKPFQSDEERLEYLFALYERMAGVEVLSDQPSLLDIIN